MKTIQDLQKIISKQRWYFRHNYHKGFVGFMEEWSKNKEYRVELEGKFNASILREIADRIDKVEAIRKQVPKEELKDHINLMTDAGIIDKRPKTYNSKYKNIIDEVEEE